MLKGTRRVSARGSAAIPLLLALSLTATAAFAGGEFDRATWELMRGDIDAALEEYESFLEENPDHQLAPLAAVAAGNLHFHVLDFPAAAESFDLVLLEYRESSWAPEAARRRAESAEAVEEWSEAADAYRLALELAGSPGNAQSAQWMNEVTTAAGECFYRLDDHDGVIRTYQQVLDGAPSPEVAATALYRLGECYEATGEERQAARSYAGVLEKYPSSPLVDEALQKRGLIDEHVRFDWGPLETFIEARGLMRQRDFPGALKRCEALFASSENPAILECAEFGKIYSETMTGGDFTGGCRRLRSYRTEYHEGQMSRQAEQTLEQWSGIADLEAQAAENPEDPDILTSLGTTYLISGVIPSAIRVLEESREAAPDRAETRIMLGHSYNTAGRSEEAAREYETYLEHVPDDVMALNAMGYAYLSQEDYERAISCFRRYAELAPEEANSHDSLGEGLMRAGRLEEAAGEYERAVELDPNFYNSHFMLGGIYSQLDETEKARQAYERLLELTPTGPQAEQARAALEGSSDQ